MNRRARLLLPALVAGLAGCAQPGTAPEAPDTGSNPPAATSGLETQLEAYHWRLQTATDAAGKRIDALFVRDDAPVQLDFKDSRVGISNTCNHMGGTYEVKGGALVFGDLNSTMMACVDEKLMALDGEVSKRLQGALDYTLAESDPPQLRLRNGGGDLLFFSAEPTAATRYGGAGERLFLEVAAQTKPCPHPLMPNKQCLQVREIRYDAQGVKTGTPGDFQHFYDNIEGYNHEPGVRNVLRVDRYTRQNQPADASRYAYVLDMVVESENVAR